MTFTIVPAQPRANQRFSCVLDGKSAQITLVTTDYGLFASVVYDGVSICNNRLCLDRTTLNPDAYRGLPQFLGFVDTQGRNDPEYAGFGTRYLLVYGDQVRSSAPAGIVSVLTTGFLDVDFYLDQTVLG